MSAIQDCKVNNAPIPVVVQHNGYVTVTIFPRDDWKLRDPAIELNSGHGDSIGIRVNLPQPNPFFTGRTNELKLLHDTLSSGKRSVEIQAISGLGGIGKTALALAYAHEYTTNYETTLFCRADTIASLQDGYRLIANGLLLCRQPDEDLTTIVNSVVHWLETTPRYLLILDDADLALGELRQFLPRSPKGRILLTTRSQTVAPRLGVRKEQTFPLGLMNSSDAEKFLRERIYGSSEVDDIEQKAISHIASYVDYLPLALEQIAAYVSERQTTFVSYLSLLRKRSTEQLERSRPQTGGYSQSVATVWAMNFAEIKKQYPAAFELLILCAFLSPDAIAMEIVAGAAVSGYFPELKAFFDEPEDQDIFEERYHELLDPLLHFSLVVKDQETRSFSIHRLVQSVFRDGLSESECYDSTEHITAIMCSIFPFPELENWIKCERLVKHGQALAEWIIKTNHPSEAESLLLNRCGYYLYEQGKYDQAKQLYEIVLSIRRFLLPINHPDIAQSLNNLAESFRMQGMLDEAEPLYKEALSLLRACLPIGHPDIANALNNLAELYRAQGLYYKAEPFYEEALTIDQAVFGSNHPIYATDLNNLAGLYYSQKSYEKAEPLYEEALKIDRDVLGINHPNYAMDLHNLAELSQTLGRFEKAELLSKESLAIRRAALPTGHPDIALSLSNLAALYESQGRYDKAEPLYEEALAICRAALPAGHPSIAINLGNLAGLYRAQGQYDKAEPLYEEALAIRRAALSTGHPDIATSLNNLAVLYFYQGRLKESARLMEEALEMRRRVLPNGHPDILSSETSLQVIRARIAASPN